MRLSTSSPQHRHQRRLLALLAVLLVVALGLVVSRAYDHGRTAMAGQSYEWARRWFRIAAWRGDARAQNNLAGLYAQGLGGTRDMEAAGRWFGEAARNGVVQAKFNLANLHEEGAGVVRSQQAAARWFESAAADGDVESMFNLGVMYASGQGDLAWDPGRSLLWYRRAAERGYASAQYNLASLYAQGSGVPQDHREARRWFAAAAAQNHAKAWMDLGTMQAAGIAFTRDLPQGVATLRKAVDLDPALGPEVGQRIRMVCAAAPPAQARAADCRDKEAQ
ncbi:hypothetical protein GN316_05300 [Xylophilus sp. Kf1]|nr:hypothetical protein [Xylophilus sp. Kf1]